MAASRGLPRGIANLGLMYLNGRGVTKDYDRALDLFRKAIELGDADAMFYLAVMYSQGLGLERDEDMAIVLLKRAAREGHVEARNRLREAHLSWEPAR